MVANNVLPFVAAGTWSCVRLQRGASACAKSVLGARKLAIVNMGTRAGIGGRRNQHGSLSCAQLVLGCLVLNVVRVRRILAGSW